MSADHQQISNLILIFAGLLTVFGLIFLFYAVRKDGQGYHDDAISGEPHIDARLEYDRGNGGLFYIIENKGSGVAYKVHAYLPKCDEIAKTRRTNQADRIANAIAKITYQTIDQMKAGDRMIIPIVQMPVSEDSVRSVYGLGLDIELRWANEWGTVTEQEDILPVFARSNPDIRLVYSRAAA